MFITKCLGALPIELLDIVSNTTSGILPVVHSTLYPDLASQSVKLTIYGSLVGQRRIVRVSARAEEMAA